MSKASEEAQKQLDRIVALGYPDVADMSAAAFRSLARPLIRALEDCGDEAGLGTQILLVPTRELVSPESLIARTSINRMAGFTTMAAARYRQLPAAGWFRAAGGAVLSGGRAAHRHLLYQPRAGRGTQADRFRRAIAVDFGRGACDRHTASGMAAGKERFQPAGLAFR